MVPTFLQNRRTDSYSLRVGITLTGLILLVAVYSVAISYVIADRGFTKMDKLVGIAFLLITALMSLGLLERLRR
jgi:hypothetical protein